MEYNEGSGSSQQNFDTQDFGYIKDDSIQTHGYSGAASMHNGDTYTDEDGYSYAERIYAGVDEDVACLGSD